MYRERNPSLTPVVFPKPLKILSDKRYYRTRLAFRTQDPRAKVAKGSSPKLYKPLDGLAERVKP